MSDELKQQPASVLPGSVTYVDQSAHPLYGVSPMMWALPIQKRWNEASPEERAKAIRELYAEGFFDEEDGD